MSDGVLERIRALIQHDVGNRGLSRDARRNQYLHQLDEGLRLRSKERVNLDDVPAGGIQ